MCVCVCVCVGDGDLGGGGVVRGMCGWEGRRFDLR